MTLKKKLLNKYGNRLKFWAMTRAEMSGNVHATHIWEDILGDLLVIVRKDKP